LNKAIVEDNILSLNY